MKRKKLRIASFNVPIWDASVVVLYGDVEDSRKWAEKRHATFDSLPMSGWSSSFIYPDYILYAMYIGQYKKDPEHTLDTIAHESIHLTQSILSDREVKCGRHDEVFAYTFQYISRKIRKVWQKWR